VCVHLDRVTVNQPQMVIVRKCLHDVFECVGQVTVIGTLNRNDIAIHALEALVDGIYDAIIRFRCPLNFLTVRVRLEDLQCFIGRLPIDDNDLNRSMRLVQNGVNGLFDETTLIEAGDHNGNEWSIG